MEWFRNWFGSEYLALYPHRNDAEARCQVDFIFSQIGPRLSGPALDIACGSGRHLTVLQERLPAVGIDLSAPLLQHAQAHGARLLARADMRLLPFADTTFGLVTNFFTGFGYFDTDAEHLAVLQEWRRVTAQSGVLVLDYLNRSQVVDTLVAESDQEHQGKRYQQFRSLSEDQLRVEKLIRITDSHNREVTEYRESVRMYSPTELEEMLDSSGFTIERVFGDFADLPFTQSSKRLVIIATSK